MFLEGSTYVWKAVLGSHSSVFIIVRNGFKKCLGVKHVFNDIFESLTGDDDDDDAHGNHDDEHNDNEDGDDADDDVGDLSRSSRSLCCCLRLSCLYTPVSVSSCT